MNETNETREDAQLAQALQTLYDWTVRLCKCAGEDRAAADTFWGELKSDPELLSEYAYYYDNREFLCRYRIGDFTIADILVWQMDHFKAHMDRADSANRYDKDKLVLSTFRTMLELKKDPVRIAREFAAETGTDLAGGWNLH